MKIFRHFSLLIAFLFLFSFSSLPQDEKAAASTPEYDPCDWAYMFSWKPNFDIGKFYVGSVYNRINEKLPVVGIGLEKYLSDKTSLSGGLSVGIDNSSQEITGGTEDIDATELGVKLSYNYYFQGRKNIISPYGGAWGSYTMLSETSTFKPVTGTESKNEYSTSSIGFGITGGVQIRPWLDEDFSLGFLYNFGLTTSPEGTIKTTSGGQTTETKGPSRFMLGDCGGQIFLKAGF